MVEYLILALVMFNLQGWVMIAVLLNDQLHWHWLVAGLASLGLELGISIMTSGVMFVLLLVLKIGLAKFSKSDQEFAWSKILTSSAILGFAITPIGVVTYGISEAIVLLQGWSRVWAIVVSFPLSIPTMIVITIVIVYLLNRIFWLKDRITS